MEPIERQQMEILGRRVNEGCKKILEDGRNLGFEALAEGIVNHYVYDDCSSDTIMNLLEGNLFKLTRGADNTTLAKMGLAARSVMHHLPMSVYGSPEALDFWDNKVRHFVPSKLA